jgi:hypothetical protein
MPSVEVVPISRPRSTAIGSPHLPDEIHESLYTIAIDGIPGIAVDLEMRADDAAIADRQDIANVIDSDAGIGEDRRVLENLLHRLEIVGFGGHSGHHPGDKHHIGERQRWDEYQQAYEEMIRGTATEYAPWYVAPADNKWFTRLVVAAAIVEQLEAINPRFPTLDESQMRQLASVRAGLIAD